MSIGQRDCCGVLEIFPYKEYDAVSHGGIVKLLGAKYQRINLNWTMSTESGAVIPVNELKATARKLLDDVIEQPSCLLTPVIQNPYLDLKL